MQICIPYCAFHLLTSLRSITERKQMQFKNKVAFSKNTEQVYINLAASRLVKHSVGCSLALLPAFHIFVPYVSDFQIDQPYKLQ